MSNMIYFGSLSAGGSAVILIEMLVMRNRKNNFVEPCHLGLAEYQGDQYPCCPKRVSYVEKTEKDIGSKFRSVDWTSHTDYLKQVRDDHQPDNIWFSSYDPIMVKRLKQVLNDEITTIAINYTERDHDFLLRKWARWQAGLLLTAGEKFESVTEAVDHCLEVGSESFGYAIPREKLDDADVVIQLRDLFDQRQLKEILHSLDCQNSQEDWDFYVQYLKYCG